MDKRCSMCHKMKDVKDFCKDKITKNRLKAYCKPCETKRKTIFYWKDEKTRRKEIQRSLNYIKKHYEKDYQRYRKDKKVKVRHITRYAIQMGKLIKKPCKNCGNLKSQAHHVDYSKPLKIKWLCSKCHGLEHRKYE